MAATSRLLAGEKSGAAAAAAGAAEAGPPPPLGGGGGGKGGAGGPGGEGGEGPGGACPPTLLEPLSISRGPSLGLGTSGNEASSASERSLGAPVPLLLLFFVRVLGRGKESVRGKKKMGLPTLKKRKKKKEKKTGSHKSSRGCPLA